MAEEDSRQGNSSEEYTEDEAQAHHKGFQVIHDGLGRGMGFDEACQALALEDPEMKRIIIDDYLKVTIADRHFGQKVSTAEIAGELKITPERVERARAEMIHEVGATAAAAFRRQQEKDQDH